jgi:hypothetical protein
MRTAKAKPSPFVIPGNGTSTYTWLVHIPLLVLHALVLFVLVAPLPVCSLLFVVEPLVIHVSLMPLVEPAAIHLVFTLIPVVIVTMIRIIDALFTTFVLFAFMSFVIVLGGGDGKCADRSHECRRYKQ